VSGTAGKSGRVAVGARYALGVIRVVNGVLGLVAPTFIARRLGDPQPDRNAAAVYGIRLFGVRTVVIGLDLLRPPGEALDRAVRAAPLIHASDTATVLTLQRRKVLPDAMARPLAAISGVNTLLAVTAALGHRRSRA
jgi:hypothetical protein